MNSAHTRNVRRSDPRIKAIYKTLYNVCGPQRWWPGDTQLEMMVGAILTQNTSWKNVEKAIDRVKDAGLFSSVFAFASTSGERLAELIRPAGYYNIKAKRLKNLIKMVMSRYNGDIDRMGREDTASLRSALLSVSGIGPETCDSILLYAFDRPVFVVDTYTKRIFFRHGILSNDLLYDEVQSLFIHNLPSSAKIFNEYHALIVRLAKDYCRTKPRCGTCPLKKYRRSRQLSVADDDNPCK